MPGKWIRVWARNPLKHLKVEIGILKKGTGHICIQPKTRLALAVVVVVVVVVMVSLGSVARLRDLGAENVPEGSGSVPEGSVYLLG